MLFVYFLEEDPIYSSEIQLLFERTLISGDRLLNSFFALGETMVGINRLPERSAESLRETLFALPFELLPFDGRCVAPFALLRNRGVRAPDAINLACAAAGGVDAFITNDTSVRVQSLPGIAQLLSISEALESLY